MNKKKIIVLSIVGVALSTSAVGYSIYDKMANQKYFLNNGYILEAKAENKNLNEVQYFSEGEKYTEKWSETIEFKNTEGEKVSAPSDTFIHYTNKDITVMDKGVLIDTNTLKNTGVTSYATPKNTIVRKTNDGYELDNLDEKIPISDYVWKVSDNKYILVSDEIDLNLGQGKEETVSDYVELTYVEGGIVRLSNDSYNYQTIASTAKVKMSNGAEVNLDNKDILVNNEVKTSLANMVIDSNDNIEIVQNNVNKPGKENGSEENKGNDVANNEGNGGSGNSGQGNNSTSNNNSENTNSGGTTENGIFSSLLNGLLGNNNSNSNGNNNNGANDSGSEEVVVKFVEPTFEFTKFNITPIGFESTVGIVDSENVLSSGVTIQLFEKSSNKLVYTQEEAQGVMEIDSSIGNLKTNTDYIMKVSASYEFNGQEYNKVFVEKQFRTEAMGIKYEKSAATDTSLTVSVSKSDDSKASGGELVVYNSKGEKVQSKNVVFDGVSKVTEISFTDLEVDTEYTVKLENLMYDGAVVVKDYDSGISIRTLKSSAIIGSPVVKINKKDLTFRLSLDKIEDKYNGVQKLTYEVYAVDDLENPVYSISKNTSSEVEVAVDNVNLFKGTNYTFRVLVDFYDNEKVVQYSSVYAEPFTMEGAQIAKITEFRAEDVRFDKIKGDLVISDPEKTIPDTAKVNYSLSGHSGLGDAYSGETGVVRDGDNIIVKIDKNGLRAGQSYDLSVMVEMDLQDGSGLVKVPLGSLVVRTSNVKSMEIEFGRNEYSNNSALNFKMKLKNDEAEYEASTIAGMKINLYRGTLDDKVLKGTVKILDSNPLPNESTIKSEFYDNEYTVLQGLFKNVNDDFTGDSYVVEVEEIYDYTEFPNVIPIQGDNAIEIKPNAKAPEASELVNGLQVLARTKVQEDVQDEKIKDDTIVKVKLNTNLSVGTPLVRVKYNVLVGREDGTRELIGSIEETADTPEELDKEVSLEVIAGTSETINYDIAKMRDSFNAGNYEIIRGNKYYFNYEVGFDLDHNGQEDFVATATTPSLDQTEIKGWQDKEAVINKQALELSIHPTSVSFANSNTANNNIENKYDWNFKVLYKDLDNTLTGNNLKITNGTAEEQVNIEQNNSATNNGASEMLGVLDLGTGTYRINGEIKYNKIDSGIQNNTYAEFYFEGFTDKKPDGSSYIENGVNKRFTYELSTVGSTAFKISFKEANATNANKIVSARVVLKTIDNSHKSTEKEYKLNNDGEIIIPFSDIDSSDLQNFRGKKIEAEVKVKYDTGEIDFSGRHKSDGLLQVSETSGAGQYISAVTNNNGIYVSRTPFAGKSKLTNINFAGNNLTFDEKMSTPHPYEFLGGVMSVSNLEGPNSKTNVLVKSIRPDYVNIEKNNSSAQIDVPQVIVPSVTISNGTTTINSVSFNYSIDQANTDKVKDYTFELYDENDLIIGRVNQSAITSVGEITGHIKFGGDSDENMLEYTSNTSGDTKKYKLSLNSKYYVKVKANINVSNGNGDNKDLIDKATGSELNKEFITLGRVDINTFVISVLNEKDSTKSIRITHELSPVSILSKVAYKLTPKDNGAEINFEIGSDKLNTAMSVDINIDKDKDIVLGKEYTLKVTPYTMSGENEVELPSTTHEFTAYNLRLPYTSFNYTTALKSGSTTDATADLTIKLSDLDNTMKDLKGYKLDIVDEFGQKVNMKDPTVTETNRSLTIKVNLDSLKANSKYRVTISGNADTDLDGEYDEQFSKTYEFKTVNSSGVNMGDVSLSQVGTNQIGVTFNNSIGLVSNEADKGAKTVKYTIYDDQGSVLTTYNGQFVPTAYNTNQLYVLTLDYKLPKQGTYNIELSLYNSKQELIDSYNGKYVYGYQSTTSKLFNSIRSFFTK